MAEPTRAGKGFSDQLTQPPQGPDEETEHPGILHLMELSMTRSDGQRAEADT